MEKDVNVKMVKENYNTFSREGEVTAETKRLIERLLEELRETSYPTPFSTALIEEAQRFLGRHSS
jgi:hypothetical protein